MSPKQAKTLLNCSYTTLANYVKKGILTRTINPINGYSTYDSDEIYAIRNQIQNTKTYEIVLKINSHSVKSAIVTKQLFDEILERLKNEIA